MPRSEIPQDDRQHREEVLAYLASRYEHATALLRDRQWDSFRAFVQLWLESFDWRHDAGLAAYLELSEDHRSQRYQRFLRQAESWDVTLSFPVEARRSREADEREAWRREFEEAKARIEERFRRNAEAWESVRQYFEAEHALRYMPDDLREAYRVLDLPPRTTLADARKRYRDLAKRLHPDVTGRPTDMARVNAAWERVLEFFSAT